VLVAVLVLTVGVLGTVTVFNTSRKLTSVAERQTSMVHRAQSELESLLATPYANLVMAAPTQSANPSSPDYYVTTLSGQPAFQYDPGNPSAKELLVVGTPPSNGAPGLTTHPLPWSDGELSGSIYDYVTEHTDPDCGANCPSSYDYKRVTVEITIGGNLSPNKPIIVSSFVIDPNASPGGGALTRCPGQVVSCCPNAQDQLVPCGNSLGGNGDTWFLYDTPVSAGTRQTIAGSHPTHATVASTGTCTASVTTGCPVPDLMGASAPPGPPPTLYNYSNEDITDSYAGGRVLRRDTSCAGTPTSTDNTKGEMWVTAPLAAQKSLTGAGGLALYTQTLNGVAATVTLCVAIYDFSPAAVKNLKVTPPTLLGTSAYTPPSWPTTPTALSFDFTFTATPVTVPLGDSIGVRIWAAAASTADIAAIYDHSSYPSELQLTSS